MLNTHAEAHNKRHSSCLLYSHSTLSLAGGGRFEPRRGRNYATAPPAGRAGLGLWGWSGWGLQRHRGKASQADPVDERLPLSALTSALRRHSCRAVRPRTPEEVVEFLFFRIPLMGRCEAVEAAIACCSGGRLSVAAWRRVQEGKGLGASRTARQPPSLPGAEAAVFRRRGDSHQSCCHDTTTRRFGVQPTPRGWQPSASPWPPAL